jgi:hypothetical protein
MAGWWTVIVMVMTMKTGDGDGDGDGGFVMLLMGNVGCAGPERAWRQHGS